MQLYTSTLLHPSPSQILYLLHHYVCLTTIFLPLLASENHVSPDVVMLNVCYKLKDQVLLYVLRKLPSVSSNPNSLENPLGLAGKCITTKLKTGCFSNPTQIGGSNRTVGLQTHDDLIEYSVSLWMKLADSI